MVKRNVRQADIAKALNISRTTVARAFSDKHVTKETREKVLAVAKEMGYVHNSAAATLALKNVKTVYCFIIGTIDEGYSTQMIQGFNDVVNLWNGYNFDIKITVTDINLPGDKSREQMERFYELVGADHPDGIIFSALCQKNMEDVSAYCSKNSIPLITLDLIYKDSSLCHIGPDYYSFGRTTASYLSGLMKRSGNILTITYDDGYELSETRMRGFFEWLRFNCPHIHIKNVDAPDMSYDTYERILADSLKSFSPDAIYAPYKMDHIVKALEKIQPDHSYIMVSNGTNSDIDDYLLSGVISGIISTNPYRLGIMAANNFFKYFYRSTEFVHYDVDLGCDIFIKENYRRYTRLF